MKTMGKMNTRLGAVLAGLALLLSSLAAQAGTITYFHNDLAGSPLVATNQEGNVIWRENYRPYGERLVNSPAASGNTVWFTSRRQDAESGLVYMGARHYDPVAGRFVSVDPVGFDEGNIHSFNRYAYANNNPYRYKDPDGRWATAIFPFVAGALIVGGGYSASPEQQRAIAGGLSKIGEYSLFGRLGAIVGQSLLSETSNASSDSSGTEVTPRPDYPPQSGGRSGEKVKDATGPPNSAIPSTGRSVWVTDGNGNVVVDVTPDRAKPVIPGVGFGDKRSPTQGELDLWNQVKEPNRP
jgi:RHS repeat-associated protein